MDHSVYNFTGLCMTGGFSPVARLYTLIVAYVFMNARLFFSKCYFSFFYLEHSPYPVLCSSCPWGIYIGP